MKTFLIKLNGTATYLAYEAETKEKALEIYLRQWGGSAKYLTVREK